MIYDDIKNFNKQFEYEPKVENPVKLRRGASAAKKFVVCGMGGSHLAADILKCWKPELDVVVWNSYGLPHIAVGETKERLVIASSYSGNTEETIDAFNAARAKHLPLAVVAAGGKLIALAKRYKVPYIEMPDMHMQPRLALGLSLQSLLALMNEKHALAETSTLVKDIQPYRFEHAGRDLAKRLHGTVPIIYASARNGAIVKVWKIKMNETGKIPAFWNVVPELNHNEMTGFDVKTHTVTLSRNFHFVFLKDADDDRQIMRRMNILEKLYRDRGLESEVILMQGKTRLQKLISALVLGDWTAYYTAKLYGVDPEQVLMVEEFKRLISRNR